METKNHWHLAEFICSEQSFKKYKKQFMLGNIMPDINLFTYLQGHTYKESISMLYTNTKSLIEKKFWNSTSFYHLGVILHYIADYFTFPHNVTFTGTLKEHCIYERRLHTHFLQFLQSKRQNYMSLQKSLFHIRSITDLFTLLEEKHHEYLSMMPSFQTDCQYIFSLTNIVAYFIPKLHEENHCKNLSTLLPSPPNS
ncbi:MAG: zinc dependent phospholipase C family protein [Lachnospiraceae bacterium]|nr:zinc dependent phospholipase C family protein [Lachnospiraceae bacterium]